MVGFGAQPPNSPANSNPSHMIDFDNRLAGIESAIDSYRNILPEVNLNGPANFNLIINFINNKTNLMHDMIYKVLVIITDGDPQDIMQTIDEIVVSSFLPITFIIVSI